MNEDQKGTNDKGTAEKSLTTGDYISGIANIGLNAINSYESNSNITGLDDYKALYDDYANMEYSGSFSDILAQRRNNRSLVKAPTASQIRRMSGSTSGFDVLGATMSGAAAGASLGWVGSAVGAGIGLASSLFGSNKQHRESKKEATNLAIQRELAIQSNKRNFLNSIKGAEQEYNFQALSNISAFGGPLHTNGADWSNRIININNGGTHEENPFDGVQLGIDSQGIPNLVEEGEVVFNNYVFSNRLKVPKAFVKKYKLGGNISMSFADAVKKVQKESEERPNDSISKRGLEYMVENLMIEQENIRNKKQSTKSNKFEDGGPRDTSSIYAPIIGLGVTSLTDALGITNKPDYSNANSIERAAREASKASMVAYTPSGNYLTYKPFDTMFYGNQLAAQANATRRAIKNNSNSNRMTAIAGLLAADYNAQQQLGNLYRQAEEYNATQKQQVTAFNNAVNKANAEGFLKAAIANQEVGEKAKALGLEGQLYAYNMREKAKQTADAARSSNISGLLDALGDLGKYNAALNARDFRLKSGIEGPISEEYSEYLRQDNPFAWVEDMYKSIKSKFKKNNKEEEGK